jgi:hypothetical protein
MGPANLPVMFRTSQFNAGVAGAAPLPAPKTEGDHGYGKSTAKDRESSGQMPKSPVESGAQTRSGQGRSGEATDAALAQRRR